MKRKICCALMITLACMSMAGCVEKGSDNEVSSIFETELGQDNSQDGQNNAEHNTAQQNTAQQDTASLNNGEAAETPANDGAVSICDETTELDYSKDYSEEIKVAVERAVAGATSFDDEFNKIQEIHEHITSRRTDSENQVEMNVVSLYYFQVWDYELNNLWARFTDTVDEQTKERVLADQRCWNATKEDAALEALGPQDEGGSIYPLLYNGFMEETTKTRCYFIAKEIAAVKGESFTMPKRSVTGSYIDNQGTESICSALSITESWESGYIAKVSLYRIGELEGTAEEAGDGKLSFTSYDETVKGTISYGWDGAVFEVTEASDAVVNVGDKYEFPVVF